MAKYRPSLPILAFSPSPRTVRELSLCWGVKAHHLPDDGEHNAEKRAIRAVHAAVDLGFLNPTVERVCVLMPTSISSTGYFCSVFDLPELIKRGFKV